MDACTKKLDTLFDLSGKVALVTGAAKGNGKGIAEALAQAGAYVYATDIEFTNTAQISEHMTTMCLDVTDEQAVADTMATIFEQKNRFDILINNAGIILKDTIEDLQLNDFNKVLNINLNGTVICTKYCIPYMKKTGGHIINISSSQAFLTSEGYSAYAASKAAVSHLTRIWGNELAPYNIIVNALCPSYVMTPMMENSIQKTMKLHNLTEEACIERYTKNVPLKRILEVEEIANWVLVLVGKLGQCTTGNNFSITGGQVQL